MSASLGLAAAACSVGGAQAVRHAQAGARDRTPAAEVRLSIMPASGAQDSAPNKGITVRAVGGRISRVIGHSSGDRVTGTVHSRGTVWHSRWALNVSQHYKVI